MIVVDTNVLVYFWVEGSQSAAVDAVLRKDPAWAAPALWRSEFRNALAMLVQRRLISLDVAHHFASQAEDRMAGREYGVITHEILALAGRSGCSAYDCEFVSVAQHLKVPLVTTDERVLRAFPAVAVRPDAFAAS